MAATTNATPVVGHPAVALFQSVVDKDYDGLVTLYASHARNSLVSYASMRSRWAHQQESYTKSGKDPKLQFQIFKGSCAVGWHCFQRNPSSVF